MHLSGAIVSMFDHGFEQVQIAEDGLAKGRKQAQPQPDALK